MTLNLKIGSRPIGDEHPTFIIAELSANHQNDFEHAVQLIEAASFAGADAVKVQTYTADSLTLDSNQDCFRINSGTVWDGQTLHELYQTAAMPWDWQPRLQEVAIDLGLEFFSSPFDNSAVEFLETLNVPAYKIASFELVDSGLLQRVGQTKKPVILSTGMASVEEIESAINVLKKSGTSEIAILKCTSAYPALPESMNLKTIPNMKSRFNTTVGLSDHTLTNEAAIAAITLGAQIVEKHLTLDRESGGPDTGFSLEPHEYASLVSAIRRTEAALGKVHYGPNENDIGNLKFRRSLFVVSDVEEGEEFTSLNVRSIRPADGLPPCEFAEIIGRTASQTIKRGTPLSWKHIA